MESFLSQAGLAAVFLFGFLEACCVPIPSEITFGFAGVLAGEGHLNIVAVIIVGTVAELLGSFVSYAVGRVGGRPLVHKFGRYLLITHADIDRAERFFAGKGAWALPVGRCLPVVRTFVSIVAGFIEMPALLFGVLSLIGTAVWVTAISLIGYSLSSTWQSIAHGIALAGYGIAAVAVIAIVALVMYRLREVRKEALAAPPRPGPVPPRGRTPRRRPAAGGPQRAAGRGPRHGARCPGRSAQAQVAHVVGGQVGQAPRGHRLPGAAFDDHGHATTSAPASRSASTAVSTDPPVVEVSSTASTRARRRPGPRCAAAARAPCPPCAPRTRPAAARPRWPRASSRWPPGRRRA